MTDAPPGFTQLRCRTCLEFYWCLITLYEDKFRAGRLQDLTCPECNRTGGPKPPRTFASAPGTGMSVREHIIAKQEGRR